MKVFIITVILSLFSTLLCHSLLLHMEARFSGNLLWTDTICVPQQTQTSAHARYQGKAQSKHRLCCTDTDGINSSGCYTGPSFLLQFRANSSHGETFCRAVTSSSAQHHPKLQQLLAWDWLHLADGQQTFKVTGTKTASCGKKTIASPFLLFWPNTLYHLLQQSSKH